MAQQWFYKLMGQQFGPISNADLKTLAQHGTILFDTLITNSPNGPWILAENVKGLFHFSNETTPPPMATSPLPSASHLIKIPLDNQVNGPTSYVAKNLMPGEKILYAASIHPLIFLSTCIPFLLIIIGFGISHVVEFYAIGIASIYVGIFTLPVFALYASAIFLTTECVLTNKRVLAKVGFLERKSIEILLNQVEGLTVNQGPFGLIFDYGTIVVSGTGGLKTPFPCIAKPLDFRKQVQQQINVMQD